jgi:hypothetical protein
VHSVSVLHCDSIFTAVPVSHMNADPCRHCHSDSVPDHRDRGSPPSKRGFPGDDSHPDGLFRLVLAVHLGADVPMRRHASALCASRCKRIALRDVSCPAPAQASAPQTPGGGPWGVASKGTRSLSRSGRQRRRRGAVPRHALPRSLGGTTTSNTPPSLRRRWMAPRMGPHALSRLWTKPGFVDRGARGEEHRRSERGPGCLTAAMEVAPEASSW